MVDQKQEPQKEKEGEKQSTGYLTPKFMSTFADEVARVVLNRMPAILTRQKKPKKKIKKVDNGIFLDTSAIIDGRIFDVIHLGLFQDTFVVLEDILLELKHLADSQDAVKRERGRKGLERLEQLKKKKGIKFLIFPVENPPDGRDNKKQEVDEILIKAAKVNKGRLFTCDYNLEKKALIQGVAAVNMNALANTLKVTAIPGESLHIKILHQGKDMTQGVGYLDDGTMIVLERGAEYIGRSADVVVSRVIQTATGRILFAKKI